MHLHTFIVAIFVFAVLSLGAGLRMAGTPFRSTRKRLGQKDPSNSGEQHLDVAATLSIVATKLRVTLPTAGAIKGIPGIYLTGGTHVGNELPTSVTQISALVFDLGYPTALIATNVAHVPMGDPGWRARNGGYIQPLTQTM